MNKDLFPKILSYTDIFTLHNCKKINKKFYKLANSEIKRRKKTKYPFGDINAKISVSCGDYSVDSIYIIFENRKVLISEGNYSIVSIRDLLNSWFIYHFTIGRFIITTKLFKSILRILNKRILEDGEPIDIDYQTLIFSFKEGDFFLEYIQ